MSKLSVPQNINYAAIVTTIKAINKLENCDNVVGVPVFGYQPIMKNDVQVGDKIVVFFAETQLSPVFLKNNNLYRDASKNIDPEKTGYFEDNGRVRAVKFRKQRSDAFALSIKSLDFTGFPTDKLDENDVFDVLNNVHICNKYIILSANSNIRRTSNRKVEESRIDKRYFPEHFDTLHWLRKNGNIGSDAELIVTQKLHGTSIRISHIPVQRRLSWYEKLFKKFGLKIQETEYDHVFGSRRVIKDVNDKTQQHYYHNDIWSKAGNEISHLIPHNFILYGELIGWDDNTPLMRNYTYNVPQGHFSLYIYRIAVITHGARLIELPWDHVKQFCKDNGLNHVPELFRISKMEAMDGFLEGLMDIQYHGNTTWKFVDNPVPLSDKKTVDEGICIRVDEGFNTEIFKWKSPKFLEHETKMMDSGEESIEDSQNG